MAMLNNKMVKKNKATVTSHGSFKRPIRGEVQVCRPWWKRCAAMRMQRLSVAWIKPEISWNSGDFMMGLQEDGIWRPYNPITTLTLN